jgi:hypothetical protein
MTSPNEPRYPPLPPQLPAHLVARLHATARVLGTTPEQIVAQALDGMVGSLGRDKRELIDRIAASLLHAHEL